MPGTVSLQPTAIPIIDFACFGDGTSPEATEIGKQLVKACREVGFAYFRNTGIPQAEVDCMFEWSRRLFSLPIETKLLAPHPKEGWKHRGYSGVGREQISQMVFDPTQLAEIRKQTPDHKESFDIGRNDCPHMSNVWLPEEVLPGFKDAASAFFDTCRRFEFEKLLPALSLGLELPGGGKFLEKYHQQAENQLRLLHYPAVPAEVFARGEKGRIGAHTDYAMGTILFQDDVGGLEVESPHGSGNFVAVSPIPGTVVFNIGDFLMRWSNDTLKSTLHRVRAPPNDGKLEMIKERFSIPYFMSSDRDILIDCLPGCWDEDRPKKYEPVTAGAYIDMRLDATY
ncbi:flavonol synthase/flavanone 3-hydroxylase [Suillus fuscotomentosus]|uniref:Flavonol synthase/flavanone 3-hydroxylase n=1 Tax=Suillus fuscotomentosus TaxID=1912939 RepID=A0AAD4HML3_9AGAM|nr:flavonol synthase/flavanone 3-hydroxylase [Suillus fuscotomentosus]KAG1901781.1 flavonol synthase/flavanone 3-hydroxylase [Suillus fuscotomentosus]